MSENPRVNELYENIRKANAELETIRAGCAHKSYAIGWYSWRIGNVEPSRICDSCGKTLGLPTQVEINAFVAEEHRKQFEFLDKEYPPDQAEEIKKLVKQNDCWTRKVE